ncbi:MAG: MBL fold metallo-hydrolase [Candidatus Melainabacteria bacterium HGW-Melainabacteria-1]|nr:MAG: MBL fold metallo-hydrolase [Candidatus Melainabacteria bacterium HGW-Melainabacteria-1]
MRVHHLNCGSLCPISRAAFNGKGAWNQPGELVCHCLLIETEAGLVLVDTGIGLEQVRQRSLTPLMDIISRPSFAPAETAHAQIRALGLDPGDVRHIVLTHLDLDHAGGLADFPGATVHLHRQEYRGVKWQPGLAEQLRYLPALWRHSVKWQTYEPLGENWFGFDAVRPLVGLPEDILLIPLTGHSKGHSGIAVDTDSGWLLHCGDAYFDPRQLDWPLPKCAPGLMALQLLESSSHLEWAHNLLRLARLKSRHPEVRLFCAHDVDEFKQLAGL